MSKVFIANYVATIPYDDAKKYGDLINVTQGYVKYEKIHDLSYNIIKILSESAPTDFLVLTGNNLVCSMVFYMWVKKHGFVNVLHWNREKYVIVHMTDVNLPILA